MNYAFLPYEKEHLYEYVVSYHRIHYIHNKYSFHKKLGLRFATACQKTIAYLKSRR